MGVCAANKKHTGYYWGIASHGKHNRHQTCDNIVWQLCSRAQLLLAENVATQFFRMFGDTVYAYPIKCYPK